MKKILVIDDEVKEKEYMNRELQREGYSVKIVEAESLDYKRLDVTGFDLAIINLYPDAPTTWGVYLDFKQYFPNCPVLVYMSHHALEGLKSAIKNVFRQQSRPSSNYSQTSHISQ